MKEKISESVDPDHCFFFPYNKDSYEEHKRLTVVNVWSGH